MASAQEQWDEYVAQALEQATTAVTARTDAISSIEARIAGLADSSDASVISVRQSLTTQLQRMNRRLTRETALKTALEARSYADLTVDEQGYVDFIAANCPSEVLRIGAQNNVDITQYHTRGLAASQSISDVQAITESDFVDIAHAIASELMQS